MAGSGSFPTMTADVFALVREGLKQCGVQPKEPVAIYTDALADANVAAAFLGAAADLGALSFQIVEPVIARGSASRVENRAVPNPVVVEALMRSRLVVDVSSGGLLYSDVRDRVLSSGGRILRVREPVDSLRRMMPSADVRRRGVAGVERMKKARTIRVTSEAGTDLTVEKGDRVVSCQYGAADEPGRWDHWPSGMVYTAPLEDTLRGRIVIAPGDLLFPPNIYVSEPVTCEIRNGHIESISGGRDAVLLEEYLGRQNNRNAYRMAHIGWGTEHRARWEMFSIRGAEGGGGAEARSAYGNVLLAFGENRDLGGDNAAPVHVDMALRRARLELDGTVVVDHGSIVVGELA